MLHIHWQNLWALRSSLSVEKQKVVTLKNIVDSLTKYMSIEMFSWCREGKGRHFEECSIFINKICDHWEVLLSITCLDCWSCTIVTPCMKITKKVGKYWVYVVLFVGLSPYVVNFTRCNWGVIGGWKHPWIYFFWVVFASIFSTWFFLWEVSGCMVVFPKILWF